MSKQGTGAKTHVFSRSSSGSTGVTVTSSGQVVWSVRDMLTSDSRRNAASVLQHGGRLASRDSGGRISPRHDKATKK